MTEPTKQEVETALRDLGAGHKPPSNWQQRVLDATVDRSPRLSRWFLVGVAVVCVAAVAVMVIGWLL